MGCAYRLAVPGLLGAYEDAVRSLGEGPDVYARDAAGRAAPHETVRSLDLLDGRSDVEAVGPPVERRARGERAVDADRLDVGVPGRPVAEAGLHLPDGTEGGVDEARAGR